MLKFFKNKKILFLLILTGIFAISEVLALEVHWPPSPIPPHITLTETSTLTDLVRYFYEWGISIGGIATFVAFLFAGFLYLTSAGDPARLREAKDRIISAFVGLALLLGSWLLLNKINPELTVLRTPEATVPTTTIAEIPTTTFKPVPCDRAIVYGGTNFEPDASSTSISTSKCGSFDWQPYSVKIVDSAGVDCKNATPTCGCIVRFYESDDCTGDVEYTAGPYSNEDLTDGENIALPELRSAKVEKTPF